MGTAEKNHLGEHSASIRFSNYSHYYVMTVAHLFSGQQVE